MEQNVSTQNRRRGQNGAAIVEASLTLMLFMMFVFLIFDFSWALFINQTLAHQARQAARWGAANPANVSDIQKMALYNNTSGTGTGILGLKASSVVATRPAADQNTTRDRIIVTISNYEYTMITWVWAGKKVVPRIQAVAPVEN